MPIPPALLMIHGIWCEDSVEHVSRVDLGRQVAVVTGVVASDQVAEGGLSIAPVASYLLERVEWD